MLASPVTQATVARRAFRCASRSSRPDRKSTRLNSSHLGISYAVFCLKKKKHHSDNQTFTKSMRGNWFERSNDQDNTMNFQMRKGTVVCRSMPRIAKVV